MKICFSLSFLFFSFLIFFFSFASSLGVAAIGGLGQTPSSLSASSLFLFLLHFFSPNFFIITAHF
jgi:hypothetical protein